MISTNDVIAAFPHAASYDRDTLDHWTKVANHAVPDARVIDLRSAQQARILFVMHHMERPPLDLKAPHVLARVSRPGRNAADVKAPHPWAGTPHGERLISAVRY